jgi:hypothetical protein
MTRDCCVQAAEFAVGTVGDSCFLGERAQMLINGNVLVRPDQDGEVVDGFVAYPVDLPQAARQRCSSLVVGVGGSEIGGGLEGCRMQNGGEGGDDRELLLPRHCSTVPRSLAARCATKAEVVVAAGHRSPASQMTAPMWVQPRTVGRGWRPS